MTGIYHYCGPVTALENLYFDNVQDCLCGVPLDDGAAACPVPVTACPGAGTSLFTDPLLVGARHLSQPPDQAVTSPAVDFASILASQACAGAQCLDETTTSTALTLDSGAADLGDHEVP